MVDLSEFKYFTDFIKLNKREFDSLNIPKLNFKTNKKVKIAILDGSPYLKLCPWIIPVNYKTDRHIHGTSVSYIVEAIVYLANAYDNVEMYGIGIHLNKESDWDFNTALKWCIDNDIQLINLSMSLPETKQDILDIQEATKYGIKIITSAGNSGYKGIGFPAYLKETIAVGALDNTFKKRDSYSSIGQEVEICFPGSFWFWTLHDNLSEIKPITMWGTSFASPCCVGVLAIYHLWFYEIYSRFPSLEDCRKFLYDNAEDIESPGKDIETGYGRFKFPNSFEVSDVKIIEMDTPMQVLSPGYSMLHFRSIYEALGAEVEWGSNNNGKIWVRAIIPPINEKIIIETVQDSKELKIIK